MTDAKGNGGISARDGQVLRGLARQVAEAAELEVMGQRRELWRRHNRLGGERPMVLVFPEGSWEELLPASRLECEGATARKWELELRRRLYTHEHFDDDTVIEKEWAVDKVIDSTGWGLQARHVESGEKKGAWKFEPVIKEPADLKKLRMPVVSYDEAETARRVALAEEVLGDILDVRAKGIRYVAFSLMALYCDLRGLEEVMMDMYDNRGMLHEAMAFLEEGHRRLVQQYEQQGLLALNNDGTYQSSGGVGYTYELPAEGYDGQRVRLCDMWASAEGQLAQVSPAMHEEFSLQYEKRLLEPFGLTGYGCCEDLTNKLEAVLAVPNIRRISISPWADVARCAETLGNRAIYSWKPHPGYLAGDFDEAKIRQQIQQTLDVTKGCTLEIILKDTHTCENHPERFTTWTRIARQLLEAV